jgi:hypothetical protein
VLIESSVAYQKFKKGTKNHSSTNSARFYFVNILICRRSSEGNNIVSALLSLVAAVALHTPQTTLAMEQCPLLFLLLQFCTNPQLFVAVSIFIDIVMNRYVQQIMIGRGISRHPYFTLAIIGPKNREQ